MGKADNTMRNYVAINEHFADLFNGVYFGGKQIITAEVPMSEIYGYGTDLRSMTGGAGDYEYEFTRYEQAPSDVQAKIVAASKAEEE